jgi:hypothetical protein
MKRWEDSNTAGLKRVVNVWDELKLGKGAASCKHGNEFSVFHKRREMCCVHSNASARCLSQRHNPQRDILRAMVTSTENRLDSSKEEFLYLRC